MSWSALPDSAASLLSPLGHDSAWEHPDVALYHEMAALLQADEPATTVAGSSWDQTARPLAGRGLSLSDDDGDDEDDDEEGDDRIGEEDIAILNQLLATQRPDQRKGHHWEKEPMHHEAVEVVVRSDSSAPRLPPPVKADTEKAVAATRGRKKKAAPLASSSSPSTAVLKIVNKTTRERQKEELLQLRIVATELESKLEQRRKQVTERASGSAAGSSNSSSSHARCAMLWAKIAKNQELEKRFAEKENAKLRQMVLGQLRLARSLEKVLRKRLRQQKPSSAAVSEALEDDSLGDTDGI